MTQDKIPFSVDLLNKGYKVVNEEGQELEYLRHHDEIVWVWRVNGQKYFCGFGMVHKYLFLLPPDEIVVEVTRKYDSYQTHIADIFAIDVVPPGKYKLVKIG